MLDSKFATSFFLKNWSVYGYRLKPFCLLHSLQLEAIGSPIIGGGEIIPFDVVVAAQICARHDVLTSYKKQLFRRIAHNADREFEKLAAYMDESRSAPDLYKGIEDSMSPSPWKAPWQLVVVTSLIRLTTISRREAWTMPEGQALWHFYAAREQEYGRSEIYTEEEQEDDEALRAENEAMQPTHDRRARNLSLRHRGLWPKGIPFDIEAELPPEAYEQLEEPQNG